MANKTGKKGKKPLQTTLGKAASQNEKEMDLSHIQKPIHTSVFGLRQVLSLFQTATEEVQNYITHECDIMYECRTCRTIFRSLANFILHKRNYCREKFKQIDVLSSSNVHETTYLENEERSNNSTSVSITRPVTPEQREIRHSKQEVRRSLTPIIEKLKEKQEIRQIAQRALTEDLSSQNTTTTSNNISMTKERENTDLLLEKIATNNVAVFQTILEKLPLKKQGKSEFMKSEVMEIHGILDSDEAVLGPDGKICTFETKKVNENPIIPKTDLFCTECNLTFSTKKTLTYHIKYKHNNTRLVYVCPDCKDSFANAWCVYRHLYKIHRRTSAQIKRMREQIHNSRIRKDQEPLKKKDKKLEKMDRTDEENQWLNNIEGDNDFQMCGGCGKRFERKAALHSHAQMCVKRIAVCNTIKENNAKKKEEVDKDNKHKTLITEKSAHLDVVRGSSKRKPYLLRTYKPNEEVEHDVSEATVEVKDICDVNANCEIVETNCDNSLNRTHKVINCSTTNTEEHHSALKGKDCVSPSMDKIDTEKMLSIIGITSNFGNITKNDNSTSNKPKDQSQERSHTASAFDLFCQSIGKTLVTETQEEIENNFPKASKTIPLILRRRHSVRTEKRNSILEQTTKKVSKIKKMLNENQATNEGILEYENIAQGNDSFEADTLPSTSSTCRISVKTLEDLIGVSTEDHIKNSETNGNEHSNEAKSISEPVDDTSTTNYPALDSSTSEDSPDTLLANLSLENLHNTLQRHMKRKRTSSFDYTRFNKSSKVREGDSFSNKEDVSFISKASLYMDTDKLLCIPCKLTYVTLSQLLWHMSAHFSWFRFQCSRCSFISFNKQDCAKHARKNHRIKKSSIESVVLPIPNWKTVLMAHDFSMLKDEKDLSGKHTDEIISCTREDSDDNEDVEDENHAECVSDWSGDLFVDSNNLDSEPENNADYQRICDNIVIKHDGIDIINNDQESFQIEVPQEIYTLDVSEIIKDVVHEERHRVASYVKTETVENDEELDNMYCASKLEDQPIVNEIKEEVQSDDDVKEKLYINKDEVPFEADDDFKKIPNEIINIRPTRNRTRSIKTLQDDFFYDLSKVIKLNDLSVNKSTSQKHKRASSCTSQKNTRDSVSSSIKSEAKPLRVYSKKK